MGGDNTKARDEMESKGCQIRKEENAVLDVKVGGMQGEDEVTILVPSGGGEGWRDSRIARCRRPSLVRIW